MKTRNDNTIQMEFTRAQLKVIRTALIEYSYNAFEGTEYEALDALDDLIIDLNDAIGDHL